MSTAAKQSPITAVKLDESSLVERVLARDERAWHQLVRQFEPTIRTLVSDDGGRTPTEVDDILGDLWLRLMEYDMRRLRAFAASRPAPLSAWLAMQATQVAFGLEQKRRDEPQTVPL